MSVEIIMFAIIGTIVAIVLFKRNTLNVKNDRQSAIQERVKESGGEIRIVEQVDRAECPISDGFNDPDSMYKFYRIRYSVDDHQKLAYGVLKIKQNWYGPSLAGNEKWMWYF